MTIPYQKDWIFSIMHEPCQKFTNLIRRYTSFHHHESKIAAHIDCPHHVQTEPCSSRLNKGCLAFGSPGGSGMKIRADAAFIFKIDRCAKLFSSFLDLRKYILFPFFNSLCIPLIRTEQWSLAAQTQLSQQSTHRSFAELDSKLSPDYSNATIARDQRAKENLN